MAEPKFVAPLSKGGKPCRNCVRLGHLCAHHDKDRPTKSPRRAGWEEVYFDALKSGHPKASAAAIADVTPRTPYLRAARDPDFAAQEEIAYNLGTSYLYGLAEDRITDPNNPSDSILKHLLACRGMNPKQIHEHSGPGGGPIQFQHSVVPVERLSPELQQRILEEMEALAEAEMGGTGRLLEAGHGQQ